MTPIEQLNKVRHLLSIHKFEKQFGLPQNSLQAGQLKARGLTAANTEKLRKGLEHIACNCTPHLQDVAALDQQHKLLVSATGSTMSFSDFIMSVSAIVGATGGATIVEETKEMREKLSKVLRVIGR